MNRKRRHHPSDLETIPGIGPSMAEDLHGLGIRQSSDLRGQDPRALYDRLCESAGTHVDRCVLYAFRCAVYYASNTEHDPDLLKWWNWTDDRMPER